MYRKRFLVSTGLLVSFCLLGCTSARQVEPIERWASDTDIGAKAFQKGDYQMAVRYYSRALQEAVRFGDQDPRVIQSLNNLADAFGQEQRLQEAQITYKAVLIRQQRLFGSDSMTLVPTLNNIVRVTCADGKCGSTLPYLQQLLSIRNKNLGPSHRDSLVTLQLIGEAYEKEGKLDKALKYFQEEASIAKRYLGGENLTTLNSSANVARIMIKRKQYAAAERILKDMLHSEEKYDWANSPIVNTTLSSYRELLRLTGRSAEAAKIVYRPKRKAVSFNLCGFPRSRLPRCPRADAARPDWWHQNTD